ncbi:MAG: prephenate dehydratase, partial [Snowella sp.]
LQGTHTALAFSRNINLSRIESRLTKRSLGEYLFFMDLESSQTDSRLQDVLTELGSYTEVLKVFGSYFILSLQK